MRKVLLLVIIGVCALQGLSADEEAYMRAKSLIDRGLGANFEDIYDASRYMTPRERDLLWERFSKDDDSTALTGMAINAFLGYGIGSFVIGDKGSGYLALGLDIGSGLAFLVGYLGSAVFYADGVFRPVFIGLGVVGMAVRLGSYIFQLISPFSFVNDYDRMLAEALRLALREPMVEPFLAFRPDRGAELGIRLAL